MSAPSSGSPTRHEGANLPFLSRLLYGNPRLSGAEILDRARAAHAHGDHQVASRFAHELADRPGEAGLRAQALTLLSIIEREEGSRRRAAGLIRQAMSLAPLDRAVRQEEGLVLLWLGQLGRAEATYRQLCDEDPDDAFAWHRLGTILTWTSTVEAADFCYQRAHALNANVVVPFHVSEEEFVQRALREWNGIPAGIRSELDRRSFEIRVAPFPTVAAIRAGQRPMLLGYCDHLLSTIVLFQRLIEWQAPDAERLQGRIRTVLHHEVGHAVGMTEDDVRGLGLR